MKMILNCTQNCLKRKKYLQDKFYDTTINGDPATPKE